MVRYATEMMMFSPMCKRNFRDDRVQRYSGDKFPQYPTCPQWTTHHLWKCWDKGIEQQASELGRKLTDRERLIGFHARHQQFHRRRRGRSSTETFQPPRDPPINMFKGNSLREELMRRRYCLMATTTRTSLTIQILQRSLWDVLPCHWCITTAKDSLFLQHRQTGKDSMPGNGVVRNAKNTALL